MKMGSSRRSFDENTFQHWVTQSSILEQVIDAFIFPQKSILKHNSSTFNNENIEI